MSARPMTLVDFRHKLEDFLDGEATDAVRQGRNVEALNLVSAARLVGEVGDDALTAFAGALGVTIVPARH